MTEPDKLILPTTNIPDADYGIQYIYADGAGQDSASERIANIGPVNNLDSCVGTLFSADVSNTNNTGIALVNCADTEVVAKALHRAQTMESTCVIFYNPGEACAFSNGANSTTTQLSNLFTLVPGSQLANLSDNNGSVASITTVKILSSSQSYSTAVIAVILPLLAALGVAVLIFWFRFRRTPHIGAAGATHPKKPKKCLPKQVLDTFPTFTFANSVQYTNKHTSEGADVDTRSIHTTEHGDTVDTSEMCTICLEGYEDPEILRLMPCGHRFHAPCVDKWLLTRSVCCPLCRADLETYQTNRQETV